LTLTICVLRVLSLLPLSSKTLFSPKPTWNCVASLLHKTYLNKN
jgi:hypothetical protein